MPVYSTYSSEQKLELINKARIVLRGEYMEPEHLKKLCAELEINDQFAYATEILLRKMQEDEEKKKTVSVKDYQSLVKYIYKDHSLPSSFKFEKALKQLHARLDPDETDNCETLGLAGAIYKRKWQYDHQFKNLILSCNYYKRGYRKWEIFKEGNPGDIMKDDIKNDNGYTGVNYAYMCELLAVDKIEEFGSVIGFTNKMNDDLNEARDVRLSILEFYSGPLFEKNISAADTESREVHQARWIKATNAEACFGLGRYNEALGYIRSFIQDSKVQPWEIRSLNQQLLSIADLQMIRKRFYATLPEDSEYAKRLNPHTIYINTVGIDKCFTEFNTAAGHRGIHSVCDTTNKITDKYGLALSGGGFRASLFQIGVLAALAEEDKLKEIEVLSCVSGGSIIGAYYYLKLKLLLEEKTDCEIDKADYINLVKEIENDFLSGVQKNLRMRIFCNPFLNLKMIFSKKYSRTHRLGELYEKHLFRKIFVRAGLNKKKYADMFRNNKGKIFMRDLYIEPKLEPGEAFSINTGNVQRENKVPQLVLNATSVNTGHNWQFTASWMGEPPGNIETSIDVKPRLRRMYYADAPPLYQRFRLGYAVGASSCVPVMFHPMPMHELYPDIDLQLIDGGLHDNQGIAALLEAECNNMIIADGSGQLPTSGDSFTNPLSLFYRADNILQERLRELQFKDVKERNDTSQILELITVHLKNDLQQLPKNWLFCTDPQRTIYQNNIEDENTDLTKYGILRTAQQYLSEIRTDLDSFSDLESYALMYSGWCQTKLNLNPKCNMTACAPTETGWRFFDVKNFMTQPEKTESIRKQLEAARKIIFKLFYISRFIKITTYILAAAAGMAGIIWVWLHWGDQLANISFSVKGCVFLLIVYLVGLISKLASDILNLKGSLWKMIWKTAVSLVACVASVLYVYLLNPLYNYSGKLKSK